MIILSKKATKKNSSTYVNIKLEEKSDIEIKSDRSVDNRQIRNSTMLSVGDLIKKDDDNDFIKKAKSNEIELHDKINEQEKEESSLEELESSQQQDYIFEVESPISTEDDEFEEFEYDYQNDSDGSSMEDLNDANIEKGYESISEEEIKLPSNISYGTNNNSAQDFEEINQKVIEEIRNHTPKSKTLRGSFKLSKHKIQSMKKTKQQKKIKKKKQKHEEVKKGQTYMRAAGRRNSKFVTKQEAERIKKEQDRLLGIKVDEEELYREEEKEEIKEVNEENKNDEAPQIFTPNEYQYSNLKIQESEDERIKKELERKKLIDQLRRSIMIENQKGKNNEVKSSDEVDLIKRLQMKVMLVTKHPDIKDQTKKIRVTN